ncbi:MAG: hypothetical protein ACKVS8_07290 [Phycisphaerales bacterium]
MPVARSRCAAALAAAALLPLAPAAALAGVTFELGQVSLQLATVVAPDGTPGFGTTVDGAPISVTSSPLSDGIKLFGSLLDGDTTTDRALSFSGERFDTIVSNGGAGIPIFLLEMSGTYIVDAPRAAGDHFQNAWNFNWDFDGGTARWIHFGAGFSLLNSEGGFITGFGTSTGDADNVREAGSYGEDGTFDYTFLPAITDLGNHPQLTHGEWLVSIVFEWTGQAPGDTFNLVIPNDSIDITVVPTPASATLAGLAGLAACKRRRHA